VRGIPVVSYLLELLDHHGVREVVVNLHHLGDALRATVEATKPQRMQVSYSEEERPLGTGGAIRRAAGFLRESDPFLVLAGDMLLNLDLRAFAAAHAHSGHRATLALRDDPRAALFGTIGTDAEGCLRRIGDRFQLPGETQSGVFVGVRAFSAAALDSLPEREEFEDLTDWLAPEVASGARDIQARRLTAEQCTWEPVGTPEEYLHVNLDPPDLPFFDATARAVREGTRFEPGLILGAGCRVESGARLNRCVVWENETVPAQTRVSDGVFAGGRFHSCAESEQAP
jgi:NDP-sugar pyrophosphorylase family protein